MKILYSAFTAFPYSGSEAQCGWAWPYAMRDYNETFLVTRKEAKPDIEKFMAENHIENINVFYHDIPSFLNIYGKTGKLYFPYYIMWQLSVKHTIRKLHKKYHFDYVQHVTLGDFRVVGTAHKANAKFIFGPVGGAQVAPRVFDPYMKEHKKSEKIREILNKSTKYNPFYRRALNKADLILAANKETLAYLSSLVKDKSKCRLLTENGIMSSKLKEPSFCIKDKNEPINILWAGRFIYRKGLRFLLEALSLVKSDRDFKLFLVGGGPEESSLKRLANNLGIEDRVTFCGRVPYTEMKGLYSTSDFFVFPSLRETTGTVLFEAMSSGLPVITFNQNGADLLIDEDCGIKVDINQSLDEIKNSFADAIKLLIENDELRLRLGKNSYQRIRDNFTWQHKCETFEEKFLKEI
ncbi:MAG: glycosyltransferase family 4 protein [Eubacterium sp.]|nr:glycosyltransferase family 4 protein [Eubacterium sp.]